MQMRVFGIPLAPQSTSHELWRQWPEITSHVHCEEAGFLSSFGRWWTSSIRLVWGLGCREVYGRLVLAPAAYRPELQHAAWLTPDWTIVLQVWMCGGTLEISTCSHVGHVFRKSTPYTFPGGTSKIVNKNNARLAEVWLDDWKEFYYSINPGQPHTAFSPAAPSCSLPVDAPPSLTTCVCQFRLLFIHYTIALMFHKRYVHRFSYLYVTNCFPICWNIF